MYVIMCFKYRPTNSQYIQEKEQNFHLPIHDLCPTMYYRIRFIRHVCKTGVPSIVKSTDCFNIDGTAFYTTR